MNRTKLKITVALTALGATAVTAAAVVEIPRWWIGRGVLDPTATRDDSAVSSVGQLKWIATQAEAEFEADTLWRSESWFVGRPIYRRNRQLPGGSNRANQERVGAVLGSTLGN